MRVHIITTEYEIKNYPTNPSVIEYDVSDKVKMYEVCNPNIKSEMISHTVERKTAKVQTIIRNGMERINVAICDDIINEAVDATMKQVNEYQKAWKAELGHANKYWKELETIKSKWWYKLFSKFNKRKKK